MSLDSELSRTTALVLGDLIGSASPTTVLVAGRDGKALIAALDSPGITVEGLDTDAAELAVTQLSSRFDVIVLLGQTVTECDEQLLRGVVHFVAAHLLPGGAMVMYGRSSDDRAFDGFDRMCAAAELDLVQPGSPNPQLTVRRRSSRYNVHDLLFEARASIRRVTPHEVMERLGSDDRPLIVDTRTATDRMRFGVIDGAIHVPRTVVEWHLDPANGYRHPAIQSFDQPIVVVCNGGYSSSLSAANLSRIGFSDVADMIGGMAAWIAADLPTVTPTHSHLGY